jgi:hypothetical protein
MGDGSWTELGRSWLGALYLASHSFSLIYVYCIDHSHLSHMTHHLTGPCPFRIKNTFSSYNSRDATFFYQKVPKQDSVAAMCAFLFFSKITRIPCHVRTRLPILHKRQQPVKPVCTACVVMVRSKTPLGTHNDRDAFPSSKHRTSRSMQYSSARAYHYPS